MLLRAVISRRERREGKITKTVYANLHCSSFNYSAGFSKNI